MQATRYARRTACAAVAATIAVSMAPRAALAFPTGSAVAPPCHEDITMRALRRARARRAEARPLPPVTRDDRALIDDLQFETDPDMNDLGAVTLLNAVRYPDLHGQAPNEVDELAQVHGDASRQVEHCLRSPEHDEPTGTESALRACRAYIRGKIAEAIDGLDASSVPKEADRVPLAIDLSLRGGVEAPLPRYFVRMGEALHAVQDGFTHTYRAGGPADRTKVTVVLDYVEVVAGSHLEERDGPAHSSELDRCDVDDPMRLRNVALAEEATTALIEASLDPAKSKEQKLADVDLVLDKYFTYEPGCTPANGWCNAPEKQLPEKRSCGCTLPGATNGGMWMVSALGVLVAGLALRRRRRLIAAAAIVIAPSVASAQEEAPPAPAAPSPPVQPTPAEEPKQVLVAPTPAVAQEIKEDIKKEEEHQTLLGMYVAGAGSFSNPGAAAMAGLRLRLGDRWALGLDGEWNGWYGINSGRMRTGAINVYASVTVRFPLRYESLNLRSTLQAGTATQVVDLFGAPTGTTGLFLGFNPLGVEYKLSGTFYAILYPLGIALPVTQLTGAPFSYPQYRSTLGLEVSF